MTLSECTDGDGPVTADCAVARPHVLFVTRKWAPAVGGMETYAHKIAKELETHAEVTVQALPGKPDGSAPGLGAILLFGLRSAAKILLNTRRFAVVHVADMSSWPLALIARLRSRKTRVALSAHGTDVAFPDRSGVLPRAYGVYMRLGAALIGSTTVVANSQATRAKTESLGFRSVTVVPLATDMMADTAPRQRGAHGRTILFAGRLLPRKGCSWFIEHVLPHLPEDVTLDVAGTVWDSKEERALRHDRVRYLGALEPDALRQAYRNADCVIVPNIDTPGADFEGFGLVAVEAAAAGGLVLASAHTGLKDAVLDGETGFSLPPGDANAWKTALLDILDWPEDRRQAFVEHAMSAAHTHFSWSRVAESTFKAYGWA